MRFAYVVLCNNLILLNVAAFHFFSSIHEYNRSNGQVTFNRLTLVSSKEFKSLQCGHSNQDNWKYIVPSQRFLKKKKVFKFFCEWTNDNSLM